MPTKSKPKSKKQPRSKRSNPKSKPASRDASRELLRHTLATLAYRGGKSFRDAPAGFAEFRVGDSTRTPGQILAHIGDLLDWALSLAQGKEKWRNSKPLAWDQGVERFHSGLQAFDGYLASSQPLHHSAEGLFQGPIADSFSHVGQVAMLRRLAGSRVRGENYNRAEIVAGRTGAQQAVPNLEFD